MTACQMVFLSFSLPVRLIHPLVSHPICSQLHWAASAHFVELLLASVALNKLSKVLAAEDNRGLPPLSKVGSYFLLPWLGYAVDNIVRSACHRALAVVPAPLVAMHG